MTVATRPDPAPQLRTQLEKLRTVDPFRALEVSPAADSEGVRRAFLLLTKRYHPTRFALEDAATRELANEVFLLIRKAYDVLLDEDKRRAWRDKVGVATSPTQPIRRDLPQGSPLPSATPAARAASQSMSPPLAGVPQRAKTASVPPARPAPATAPPSGAARAGNSRPSTAAGSPATAEEVQAMLEQARTRVQRFDDAVGLIRAGQFKQAREALYKIAMEDPQNKRYRVQMHLAWGLEHLAENRLPEGQRELERVLALDPASAEAKEALKKLGEGQDPQGPGPSKKPGLFGKLFGK